MICPDLHDVEWSVWESFWELSTERQIGMSAGPIPVSKIIEHANTRSGVPSEALIQLIRIMDAEYLKPPPKGDGKTIKDAFNGAKEDDGSSGARPQSRNTRRRRSK